MAAPQTGSQRPIVTQVEDPPPVVMGVSPQGFVSLDLDVETVTGLLQPFSGRARKAIEGLLNGMTFGMAYVNAGYTNESFRLARMRDPEFAAAVEKAADMGFRRVYERELYDRALDRNDRASGRLLELILKARSADYREKAQLQMSVIHAAADAFGSAGGWKQVEGTDATK